MAIYESDPELVPLEDEISPAILRARGYITDADAHVAVMAWDGLASPTDLARRWGVSRQRGWQLTREPGFPAPIGRVNGHSVYLVAEADEWREGSTNAAGDTGAEPEADVGAAALMPEDEFAAAWNAA